MNTENTTDFQKKAMPASPVERLVNCRTEIIGDCTLYLGDCSVILPQLPDFDLILTDPPYGIGEAAGKNKSRSSKQNKKRVSAKNPTGKGIASTDFGFSGWDNKPPDEWIIGLLLAKGFNQILFGGNYFTLPPTSCVLVWDKDNTGDFADCELAWTNLKKAVRIKKHRWNGMLQENMAKKEKRVHPTQKPVPVMEWCLSQVPNAITVCDPFMGSGTTGVACVNKGLEFVGIEREEKYFDIACERIMKAIQTKPRLFDAIPKPKQAEQLSLI